MVITELYIKNFGKFTEQHIYLADGIQVICGENEFGKSTIHAFIRAMLFGLERGRGRAAAKDEYTRYEPWENPGYYAGVMRFSCGGRNFRLERNFARTTRRASLVCEDDGEELSLEHGDLDMLIGGMTQGLFDSTVSVGQLRAEPGQELYEALENRAANYFETGSGELDIASAFQILKEKQRNTEKAIREEEAEREAEQEKLRSECAYLEQDMQELQREYDEKQARLKGLEKREGSAEQERADMDRTAALPPEEGGEESVVNGKSFIWAGIAGLLAGATGTFWSLFLSGRAVSSTPFAVISVLIAAAGLLFLLGGIYVRAQERRRERSGAGTVSEQRKDSIRGQDEQIRDAQRRLQGEMDHIRSVWKEKEIRCENLREQSEEYVDSASLEKLRRTRRALTLAEETLKESVREMGGQTAQLISKKASEIFNVLTGGAYKSLRLNEGRHLSVWDGVRSIPAERLSRGTVEQIYLAVRLAASDVLLEEPMPVILDDVFAFYDDKRLDLALKWLSRQEKQVKIFTCHKREEEIVKRVVYS